LKFLSIDRDIELVTGDITDENSMNHLIKTIRPIEFYNLAAQSFVGLSWELNKLTTEVNALGPLNILNAIRTHSANTKYYQASTSEMFGNSNVNKQCETTAFKPRSPYGVSKLYAHWMTVNFRESYSLHASNGILFNHESPLRGIEFVTRKITDGVAKIKLGLATNIVLGNLDSRRDWGYAGDFVEAMWLMLQQDSPDDYVISTGITHSIYDLLDIAFKHVDIENWETYITTDPAFKRPAELHVLCGDYSKAQKKLGWAPKTNFKDMIEDMIDSDMYRHRIKNKI
jgi:GDPmannose 4,6-dehydratase